MAPHKVVVHDVLGTLFDLSAPIEELKAMCAKGLQGAPDHFAELIVMVSSTMYALHLHICSY